MTVRRSLSRTTTDIINSPARAIDQRCANKLGKRECSAPAVDGLTSSTDTLLLSSADATRWQRRSCFGSYTSRRRGTTILRVSTAQPQS